AWLMMIGGIAVTAGVAGGLLDPFSHQRLLAVSAGVAAVAFALSLAGLAGVERGARPAEAGAVPRARMRFMAALAEVWAEPQARIFTLFVFASMLAYSAQDLILEPFAGHVFGMTPGQSTQLAGVQHGGVFLGMAVVGILGTALGRGRPAVLRGWTIWGCVGSALALIALAWGAAQVGGEWPLRLNVFVLGVFNGAFAVAAIGSMMGLASDGAGGREGTRVGLWGAAQAVAFGLGGFLGTVAVDLARALMAEPAAAYSMVFAGEGLLFLASAVLAARVGRDLRDAPLRAAPLGIAGE
ncbi:MAG: PucC family protein, partial [Thermohalobaculum sp.]|nr:PucC family protein [Thermohalobaculum sp.]